jgi:hypothetical protein
MNKMKQETLEEAMIKDGYFESDYDKIWREGVQFGAKWQEERMYSEEEVKGVLMKTGIFLRADLDIWFEQNKKKGGDK